MPFMRDRTIGTNRDSFVGKLLNASYSERTNTVPHILPGSGQLHA